MALNETEGNMPGHVPEGDVPKDVAQQGQKKAVTVSVDLKSQRKTEGTDGQENGVPSGRQTWDNDQAADPERKTQSKTSRIQKMLSGLEKKRDDGWGGGISIWGGAAGASRDVNSIFNRKSVIQDLGGEEFERMIQEATHRKEKEEVVGCEEWRAVSKKHSLVFREHLTERIYIMCFSRKLAQRFLCPLGLVVLYSAYSITEGMWSIGETKENYASKWDVPAVKAFNITWILIGSWGFVMLVCLFLHSKGFWHESSIPEYALGISLGIIFWPGTFLGNRWRCASLFGVHPDDVFGGYTSDAEFLLLLDSIISYIVIFTPMRLVTTVFVVVNMVLCFIISTAIVGQSPKGDSSMSVVVAVTLYVLSLMEQQVVEKFKRQMFYSLYRAQRDNVMIMSQGASLGQSATGDFSGSKSSGLGTSSQGPAGRSTLVTNSAMLAGRIRGKVTKAASAVMRSSKMSRNSGSVGNKGSVVIADADQCDPPPVPPPILPAPPDPGPESNGVAVVS